MPPRRLSDSDYEFIEEVAQQRAKFSRIRQAQSEVLRSNVPEYEAAVARFLQKTTGIHVGKNWQPPPDKIDEYIEECEKICQREINSIDETNELLDKSKAPSPHRSPQMPVPTNTTIPAALPTSRARPLTSLEVEQFVKNFALFEEKQFVLNSDASDDVATYEVITQFRRTGEYEVLIKDSQDNPIKVCKEELRKMLKDSQILV